MHFALSDEQGSLQEAARAFLGELPGPLSMTEAGQDYPDGVWTRIVEEQGWPAILIPESAGGWSFGLLEMAVVMEASGRAMTPSPLFGTVGLAVSALLAADPERAAPHLEAIAAGTTATAAWHGDVRNEVQGWSGELTRVVDGHSADLVVVLGEHGLVLPAHHMERTRLPSLDTSRPLARLDFDRLTPPPGADIGPVDRARMMRVARVLLAAESVGSAQRCLDESVDYATVRQQFGQPIGRFQSIQHMLADVCVQLEAARAATWYAATAHDHDLPDASLAALTAAAQAGDAFFHAAGQCIQVHGGIGFTWEHPAHMLFKRARASRALLGEPRTHRAAVADALLGPLLHAEVT